MMTEFEVQNRVAVIRNAHLSPMRKARLLLRLDRTLEEQEHRLFAACNSAYWSRRLHDHTRNLRHGVREEARRLIRN